MPRRVKHRSLRYAVVVLGVLALGPAAAAPSAAPGRVSGHLDVDATFKTAWKFHSTYCPPGTNPGAQCVRSRGTAIVSGLGNAVATYTKMIDDQTCTQPGLDHVQFRTLVVAVAGKGDIELSLDGLNCYSPPPINVGPYELRITGASGTFAGAAGTMTFKSFIAAGNPLCSCGASTDTLTGTVSVPGHDFDVTPPVLSGLSPLTATARKPAKRVRVRRYGVTATDAVDGQVKVDCTPRAGSFFKLGRTIVHCGATDTSGNAATGSFTVAVQRRG